TQIGVQDVIVGFVPLHILRQHDPLALDLGMNRGRPDQADDKAGASKFPHSDPLETAWPGQSAARHTARAIDISAAPGALHPGMPAGEGARDAPSIQGTWGAPPCVWRGARLQGDSLLYREADVAIPQELNGRDRRAGRADRAWLDDPAIRGCPHSAFHGRADAG